MRTIERRFYCDELSTICPGWWEDDNSSLYDIEADLHDCDIVEEALCSDYEHLTSEIDNMARGLDCESEIICMLDDMREMMFASNRRKAEELLKKSRLIDNGSFPNRREPG